MASMTDYSFEDLSQALFKESQDALFIFDPESDQMLDVNPMAQRMTGFPAQELVGMKMTYLFRYEVQGGTGRLRQAASHTGIFHSQEGFLMRTRTEGHWVPVNVTITRLHLKPRTLGLISARDMTEQRQARQLLQRTEAEMRRVVSSVSDCLWSAERDGKGLWAYRYFSPVVEKITGRAPEYFQPGFQRWAAIVHPEDRTRWESLVKRVRGGQAPSSEENYRVVHPDGSHRWVRDSINATRAADGKPTRLDGILTDITERKRAEDALQQERELLNSLMDNIPDQVYFKDDKSRFLRINRALAKRFGLSDPNQAVGKSDFDFFARDHAQPAFDDEQRVMKTGQPLVNKEECETWPDGHTTWVSTTKMPLRDRTGQVIGTFGVSRDITARRRAEDEVRQSERRYRTLTEASLDAIVVTDRVGCITLFNPAAERTFGYEASEILGKSVALLIPEEFKDLHERGLERFVATRQSRLIGRTVEMRGRHKDGTEFPLELSLTAIEVGAEVQLFGTVRDLTERNRLRAVIAQSEKLASIGLLSAGVAHEINNPLAYVSNNLAVLERDNKGLMTLLSLYEGVRDKVEQVAPEEAAKIRAAAEEVDIDYVRDNLDRLLTRTRDGVGRVARIVQSLRGLARTAPPEREDASLTDIVDMSLEMVRGQLQRRGIDVQLNNEPAPLLRCVPTQLSQVVLNLLVNAQQAIESKGHAGAFIHITTGVRGDEALIEVADNGCGIPAENIPKLFDPFFTTKPVGEGTGLGLSITHGIISGHGGRIEVDSRPGEGTCFSIYLPLGTETGNA